MREKLNDRQRLLHIMEAIENIFEFTNNLTSEDFTKSKMTRFAVIKNLEIIGEAAWLVSDELKTSHSAIVWNDIIKMRHILVHDYFQINDKIIWETIVSDLPVLKKQISILV